MPEWSNDKSSRGLYFPNALSVTPGVHVRDGIIEPNTQKQ